MFPTEEEPRHQVVLRPPRDEAGRVARRVPAADVLPQLHVLPAPQVHLGCVRGDPTRPPDQQHRLVRVVGVEGRFLFERGELVLKLT